MIRPAYLNEDDDFDRVVQEVRRGFGGRERVARDQHLSASPAREHKVVESVATVANAEVPSELFPPLPAATPFPAEALGVLQSPAEAIARVCQTPLAMAAQSVLAVAALASQAHADVLLPFGQTRPLSLFFVTIARSGDRKSTADKEASRAIVRHEIKLREDHREAMKLWSVEQAAWAAQRRRIEGDRKTGLNEKRDALEALGPEPQRPLDPFLIAGDLTLEGLTKAWANAHGSLGVFTAEGGLFTGGHGMSEENRLRSAAALSQLWDGETVKRIRAQDGATILPGRRLSLHLMVQPDAATDFLSNKVLRDQGSLSRMLVASPDSIMGTRFYRDRNGSDVDAIRAFEDRVESMLAAPPPVKQATRNELVPCALPMSADAERYWKACHDNIERQVGKGGEWRAGGHRGLCSQGDGACRTYSSRADRI